MNEASTQPPAPRENSEPVAANRAARAPRLLTRCVAAYAAAILLVWAWMLWDGDRGALATLLLFGPRWLCGLPLVPLVVAALVYRRVLLLPLALIFAAIVWLVMGCELHVPALASARPTLRVLTCNVDERRFSIQALAELIETEQPDVVAIQEVRQETPFVWPAGWQVLEQDQFILACRWPIADRGRGRRLDPPDIGVIRYVAQSPAGPLQFFNLHLSTPRPGLEAMLHGGLFRQGGAAALAEVLKLREVESEALSNWIAQFPGPKIIMGDFNMPTESTIFRRFWSRWTDAFSTVGWGFGFTKITGDGAFSYGTRIDHVLASPEWRCLRCWVGPSIGSDHLPLLAEFELREVSP